jgi:putative phosphoribosyl transferase
MRYRMSEAGTGYALEARIPARSALLEGEIHAGDQARGIVLFAHGAGSSRYSPPGRHLGGRPDADVDAVKGAS